LSVHTTPQIVSRIHTAAAWPMSNTAAAIGKGQYNSTYYFQSYEN